MKPPDIKALVAAVPSGMGSHAPLLEEIRAALESPRCNLVSVAESIEKDPNLTARLLRFANSSFCGFANRIGTLLEAISLIGLQPIHDFVLASAVLERFEGVPEQWVSIESFWRHSLACGLGARLLARERRLPKPDQFFVAGLLHDIGRLVLFAHAPQVASRLFQLCRQEKLLMTEAEAQVLGFNHQHVGEALLRHWNLPSPVVLAVGYHHRLRECAGETIYPSVVHVSDYVVNAMDSGSSGEAFVPRLDAIAWQTLGLNINVLPTVVAGIDEELDAVQELFLQRAA